MSPGVLRDRFKWFSREVREQWEDPGVVQGRAEETMSDLSLRFPFGPSDALSLRFSMFWGHLAL